MLVFISGEYPPRLGGAGTLAKKIGDSDEGITMLYPRFSNKAASRKSIFRYCWLLELTVLLIFRCPNNSRICLNDFGALTAFYIARKVRRLKCVSLSYLHHGLISESYSKAIPLKEKLLVSLTKRLSCKHFSVSDFLADRLIAKHGIVSTPLPVGVFAMSNAVEAGTDVVDRSNFVIVIASRLNSKKLPLKTFELVSYLQARIHKNIVVEVFGDGDSDYVNELSECAKNLDFIVNFNGNVPSLVVNTALNKCDLVVNASLLVEAAPTIGFEAASHGKPYLYFTRSGHIYTQQFNKCWSLMVDDFGADSAELIVEAISRNAKNGDCQQIPSRDDLILELFSDFN